MPALSEALLASPSDHRFSIGKNEQALDQMGRMLNSDCCGSASSFFLYGPAGVGKSLFAARLAKNYRDSERRRNAICLSAGGLIRTNRHANLQTITGGLEKIGLFVLDDIDELSHSFPAQRRIVPLLDDLLALNCRLFFISRFAPYESAGVSPQLRSRLRSAALIRMVSTQADTEWNSAEIPPVSSATFTDRQISQGLAALNRSIAKYFAIPPTEIRGRSRRRTVVLARGFVVLFARQRYGISFRRIGAFLGSRDHTTTLHAFHKVNTLIQEDKESRHTARRLMEWLETGTLLQ